MDSKSVLKDALALVRMSLKSAGFSNKANAFWRAAPSGNVQLISFQAGAKSSAAESLITVNYGVFSTALGKTLGEDEAATRDVMKAHWRKRLSDGGREKWVSVKAADSADKIAAELTAQLQPILTELGAHATNDALRDQWLTGMSPGLGKMQRLMFLAVLLKLSGDARLTDTLTELRSLVAGGIHEGLVRRQLEMAGIELN